MFTSDLKAEIISAARQAGLDPAALLAVVEVESNGQFFANVNGRAEPLIRFEGHYFDRRLPQDLRDKARKAGLSDPAAGKVANPRAQSDRWQLFARACALSQSAAYESTSWGIGQVMGAHWKSLGYASVEELAADARSGAAGQLRLMTAFIQANSLAPLLADQDWAGFARRYNGPGFAKNNYEAKLKAAYARHSTSPLPLHAKILRTGSEGPAVEELQLTLTSLGFAVPLSGKFDKATLIAMKKFQSRHGLSADGIIGERTSKALAETAGSDQSAGWFAWLLQYLRRLFGLRP